MVNFKLSKYFKTSTGTGSSTASSRFSAASGSHNEAFPKGHILPSPNLRSFSLAELKKATINFRPDLVIGEGGFGRVFKGWLDEKTYAPSRIGTGTVIAVKKLNPEGLQGLREWQSEVNFLGRLSHPNLVKLLGYCQEDKELLLVYEFMPKGSWENHLFRRVSSNQPLPWDIRLKIAIGAARGLSFLHSTESQIIYRDFKTSNILLDGSYIPKLSDFGLAKMGPSGCDSHVSTRVVGTYGHAAPEYLATGHLYVKSDVYGFGVVLLEMLTGLRVMDKNRQSGQHNLVDWAKPFLANKRRLKDIMDSRLEGQYPSKGALQVAELSLKCLITEPKSRPSMEEVLEILERIEKIKAKPTEARTSYRHHVPCRQGQHPMHHSCPLYPNHDGTTTGSRTHQYPTRTS